MPGVFWPAPFSLPLCMAMLQALLFHVCFSVGDKNMLEFIRDKTADPYFWNLVWFIGSHAIELDNCVQREAE